MATHKPGDLPSARIVQRPGVAPPPPPRTLKERVGRKFEPLEPGFQVFLRYAIGLWPVWAICLMFISFLWAAGFKGSP